MTDVMAPAPAAPPTPSAPPPGTRTPRSLTVATALWTLASLSVLAVWFAGYVLVVGSAQEQGDQQRLFAKFRAQLSQATAPLGPTAEGSPVALLDAPRGGIGRAVVVEGATSLDLQSGPGHKRDTVLPGQVGVSVLYGRGATFGGPFKHIAALRTGDPIQVTTGQGTFGYTVTGTRHGGDPEPAPLAAGAGRLTLVTVTGTGWRAGWAPTDTTYVDAVLDKAQPTNGRRVAALPAERVLAGSHDAPLPLVLWLEALLVVVVGGVWAWGRWGRWQSWIVVSPVLVAVLVGASRTAAQLLPNLL